MKNWPEQKGFGFLEGNKTRRLETQTQRRPQGTNTGALGC